MIASRGLMSPVDGMRERRTPKASRRDKSSVLVEASMDEVFAYADDHTRLPSHTPLGIFLAFKAASSDVALGLRRWAARASTGKVASMKVFIVEDSQPVRERLNEMLSALPGTDVVGHATSADSAIRDILAVRPDVVVLDLSLASGSGFDVLRAVRDRAPEVDFYMLSNFAAGPYRQVAERLGARGFFDKTTEFERVRDVVGKRAAEQHQP